jgi:hypothetical protein
MDKNNAGTGDFWFGASGLLLIAVAAILISLLS